MRVIAWEFNGFKIPMVEDGERNLFCTTKQLSHALNTDERQLRRIRSRHLDEFEELGGQTDTLIPFLEENKSEFGIQRIKRNMTLWSEDHMILTAVLSKSNVGKEFRRGLVKFIKKNACRGYITQEQFDTLKNENANLNSKFNTLSELVLKALPAAKKSASAFGAGLRAQQGTKDLRLMH